MNWRIPNNEINFYKFDKNNDIEYNEKDYDRIISIGDIHGCYSKLIDLLDRVQPTNKDLLIFHGDYLDRGNENVKCMKFVTSMINYKNIIFLIGNHELLLLQHIANNTNLKILQLYNMPVDEFKNIFDTQINKALYFKDYLYNGGYATFQELNTLDDLQVFKDYIYTISNLYTTFEMIINNQLTIFVHAGINPNKNLDEQDIIDFTWTREPFLSKYQGDTKFVIGHTPTNNVTNEFKPVMLPNNILMIDTGSWRHCISAINIKTNHYWQDHLKPFIKPLK